MKDQIIEFYCEKALDNFDKLDSEYKATRESAHETYEEFTNVANRMIRKWTSEFRHTNHPYNIDLQTVQAYLEESDDDKTVSKGQQSAKKENRLEANLSLSETDYCNVGEYTVYQFDHRDGLVKVHQEIRDEILFLYCEEGFTKGEVLDEIEHPVLLEEDIKLILNVHDKKHDSTPFTIDRVEDMDVDDMIEDTKRRKEQLYKKESQKDEKPFEYFMDRMGTPNISIEPMDITVGSDKKRDWGLFIPLTDVHLGARSVNSELDLDTQIDYIEKMFTNTLFSMTMDSLPSKIYLMLMGDTFHTDSSKETTWYGTSLETCADHDEIIHEGHSLILRLIEACQEVADTEVVLVKGNHDRDVTVSLAAHLKDIADHRDFTFDPRIKNGIYAERQYFTYGNNLIGATHQRNESLRDLDSIMMREADKLMESGQHRYFFGADKHTELTKDDYPSGMKFYRNAKLGPLDSHESKNGWYARSGLRMFGFDPEHGKKFTETTWASEIND